MKICIAEDDPIYRRVLESLLERWDYETVAVADGLKALEILEGDDAPEIAILDWMMPGLDGKQVCQRVRQRKQGKYIYIILLTAKDRSADMVLGLEAGADDYLIKPYQPPELKARLAVGRRILTLQSELLASREEMRLRSLRDSLTGTWNHTEILGILTRELHRSSRQEHPVAVLMADLDNFKRINDTHGHLAGDAVLREVSARILQVIRPYDTLGRYGGEEFLIVFPCCDETDALACGERLRQSLCGKPITYDSTSLKVTVSIGVAVGHANSLLDPMQLVKSADAALYEAKSLGRNRVVLGRQAD